MKTLYLDIFSGISGDMFIGAMLDLGADPQVLEAELRKLLLKGYHIHVSKASRMEITGVKFDVHCSDHHSHDHKHAHDHEHSHSHADHSHGHGDHKHEAGHSG